MLEGRLIFYIIDGLWVELGKVDLGIRGRYEGSVGRGRARHCSCARCAR